MMDEGRSSRNSHYSIGNASQGKTALGLNRSFRSINIFFFFPDRIFIMHAFSHSMSRIGHTNWRPLLLSLFVIHTKKNEFPTSPCLFGDVFFSLLFKQYKRRRKIKRFDAEDFVWKGRWSGHASSPTDSARKCRSWNAWSMSTEMKAVLVGQPSFAFLFKRFPFFFIFSPISIGSERGDVDGERGNKCWLKKNNNNNNNRRMPCLHTLPSPVWRNSLPQWRLCCSMPHCLRL